MSYYIPTCPTPPAPTCSPCWNKEMGRVRGVALIKQSLWNSTPNWQNPAVWTNGVCNGQIFLFPYTNGSVAQNEKLSMDYGSVPEGVDSYEYVLDLSEPQIFNNIPFWNAACTERDFVVAYVTETLLWIASANAMIVPKAPVANSVTDKVDIKVQIKFIQNAIIVPQTQPVGIFTNCVDC